MVVLPAVTSAQVRVGVGVRVAAGRQVVIGGGYYRPYYRPFYRPYFYGSLFYNPFYFYPSPFWYPAAYYGYPGPYYYGGAGSLRLQVTPPQTEVFIDGYYAGNVDDFDGFFQRLNIEPGEHDLELYLPGHRIVQQKVYLQPGRTFRVRYLMEPLRPGEPEPLRPANSPPGAGPAGAPRPYPGPGPNAPPPQGGPYPPAAPRTGVTPVSGYGTLALRVQPADADVLIDGERWTGPQGDAPLEVQLPTGTHNVEIRKDGYRIYSTDVTIRGGDTATLNVALRRQ